MIEYDPAPEEDENSDLSLYLAATSNKRAKLAKPWVFATRAFTSLFEKRNISNRSPARGVF